MDNHFHLVVETPMANLSKTTRQLKCSAAQRKYRAFVAEGIGHHAPWEYVWGQVLLGNERFVERLAPGLHDIRRLKEIPRQQRFATRPTLSRLFGRRAPTDQARRNEIIRWAHLKYGYSLSEIGQAVDLHYSTISRIVNVQDRSDTQNKSFYLHREIRRSRVRSYPSHR